MPTVTAYQPFNQLTDTVRYIFTNPIDYVLDGNVITRATFLALNGEELTLYGSVVGNDYYTATGVLYGYSEANNLGIKYSVTDFAVSWQEHLAQSNGSTDTIARQSWAFQGNDTFLGSHAGLCW